MIEQVKRELSQQEIDEKTGAVLELMRLNDAAESEIAALKSEQKFLQTKISERVIGAKLHRIDIERGYVWEDVTEPQQELPLADLVNKVADELQARGAVDAAVAVTAMPSYYDRFVEEYPRSKTLADLGQLLSQVLTEDQCTRFFTEEDEPIVTWHPQSGIFDAVDWWARIEVAKADAEAKAQAGEIPTGGMTIPARVPMPEALEEIVGGKPLAKKGRKRKSAAPTLTQNPEGGASLSDTASAH